MVNCSNYLYSDRLREIIWQNISIYIAILNIISFWPDVAYTSEVVDMLLMFSNLKYWVTIMQSNNRLISGITVIAHVGLASQSFEKHGAF